MRTLPVFGAALALYATALPAPARADDEPKGGEVRLPLSTYQGLTEASRTHARGGPKFAIGEATINVNVAAAETGGSGTSAEITAEFPLRTIEGPMTVIPLLPPGTPVTGATIDGSAIELLLTPAGLAIAVADQGAHRVQLSYFATVQRSGSGMVLAFPLPPSTSAKLTATIPGANLDASVVPSAREAVAAQNGDSTTLTATLPHATAAQISWHSPAAARQGHALSRARWVGTLAGDAVRWKVEIDAEVFGAEAEIAILPSTIALSEVTVDGKPATVVVSEDNFATLVKGRGRHKVAAELAVPVMRENGPPKIELALEPVPMSRFELELPGKKEITAEPASNITLTSRPGSTFAVIHAPMTEHLAITWSEAVPEDAKADVRANASVYHAVFVEEGVLHATAYVVYEVTRGETNLIELELPDDVQVNQISAANGAVSDWRLARGAQGKASKVSVFLDRKVKGEMPFEVKYERLVGSGPEAPDILGVPVLRMLDVHRQRGMVALLASQEASLKPVEESQVTKVGENQLPAFVRQAVSMTVAHTYKYVEATPRIAVQTIAPERKQGRFDASIDTLFSLSDVAMKGSAAIAIDVKSGKLMVLELVVPADVNVLGLAAPSLRTHRTKTEDGVQKIEVQFTQEMEGQFAIDLSFERILADHGQKAAEALVPDVTVSSAEVVQGRIAVEALAAVEVKASRAERLSPVDPSSLPQQLVLKTTNPILLAYEYVRSDPAPKLSLEVSRHTKLDTQIATIDTAKYETLFTRDGLAVTTARFVVRNSRKQFLELQLPEGSEVWSALVDGKSEKPALAEGRVLIQVISSAQGFPVELVYSTKIPRIGALGSIGGTLPRPDMVVTQTRWDVFLPDGLAYDAPSSNLDLTAGPRIVPRAQMAAGGFAGSAMPAVAGVAQTESPGAQRDLVQPLRISVPMAGVAYTFEKLYANQSDDAAKFSIAYASASGRGMAHAFGLFAAIVAWAGLLVFFGRIPRIGALARLPLRGAMTAALAGGAGAVVAVTVFSASMVPIVLVSILAIAIVVWPRVRALVARRVES